MKIRRSCTKTDGGPSTLNTTNSIFNKSNKKKKEKEKERKQNGD